MEQTIAIKVFEFIDGKDISDWIKSVGNCNCWYDNDDVLVIDGKIRTALNRKTDPINIAICLCLVLFGLNYIKVCPNITQIVDSIWKKRLGKKSKPVSHNYKWIELLAKTAIQEGKLFELIFGAGKRLWENELDEEEMRKVVRKCLKE